ncbi:VWA domain-containing protein [Vibrio astriarenae]|uniref:VWA domain-containing protein n=1 Tax=Vibrio astriarenae TaxID=1481923 RepID=A0A7Z2YG49_9VIBR|nr:VWA domain-containing protein [Vibrio astriarenae]QIA66121.1 VWA domain-containing protein [Vibrio astriarenae]
MAEFHFIRPWLLLLLLPILVLFRYLKARKEAEQALPIASHLQAHLAAGQKSGTWFNPQNILPWMLSLLAVISAGPTWQPEPDSHTKNQSPIYFVIDLSRSMTESDIAPNRLENSKIKLADFLSEKTDGVIGAYVYAGSSHMLIPPTEDREVLELYLSALSSNIVPRQGKDLASVLSLITDDAALGLPGSVIVISDSLDNRAHQAIDEFVSNTEHQLLFWKFGYAQSISTPRGATYLQNTPDNSDIRSIVRWVDGFRYFDPLNEEIQWQEAGYFLVFPTLLLSLLWFRRGWSIRWIPSFLICVLLGASLTPTPTQASAGSQSVDCDTLWMNLLMTPDQQGQWFYNRGNYQCAANSFIDSEWKIRALMKNKQWEWALTMLNNQPDSIDKRFNVALSYLNIQRFRSAQHWFEQVLELAPQHPQTLANLALLDEIFDLMAARAQGQGTAGEDMTADVISTLEEDMQIEEPEDKVEVINSADLMAEEHLTKIWLEQVKSNPEVFLRNKFAIQLQKASEVQP